VRFNESLPKDEVTREWESLVHQLDPFVCASLLEPLSTATATPSLVSSGNGTGEKNWRYGLFPDASMCSADLWHGRR